MPTMLSPAPTVTAAQLLALPDDDTRRELVRGELRTMSPAGRTHGRIAGRVFRVIDRFVEDAKAGTVYAAETGFWIEHDPDTVRAPDVAFVTAAREAAIADTSGFFQGPPDLAVEVLSPSDRYSEVVEKAFAWIDAGTRSVWLVDPCRETVTVIHRRDAIRVLEAADTLAEPDLLPGFTIVVQRLFER